MIPLATIRSLADEAVLQITMGCRAYRSGGKMPSTKTLSNKIQDLTAVPVAAKAKRSRKGAGKTAKTAAEKAAAKVAALWTEYETLAMTKAQATGLSVFHVVVKIDPHCAMPIAGRQLVQGRE